jgi:small ligand-binding sensory domain FIST
MISPESHAPCAAAVVSENADSLEAAREVCRRGLDRLKWRPHLAIVFASFQHQPQFAELAKLIDEELGADCLIGCTGESVVAGEREIEGSPSLALWLAHLPETTLLPMHLEFQATRDGGTFSGWHPNLAGQWPAQASMLLLGEPFSFPADVLLNRLNEDHPRLAVTGGMASGGWGVGQNRLLLGGTAYDRGAVAVVLHGATGMRTVVSQGCRPVGRPLVVTKAEQNILLELGGKPALAQLQEIFGTLTPHEQSLFRHGLHVGQVVNEYQDTFGRGDFLVRNVEGADPKSGAIAVGDYLRVGQTVQFHVRDAGTADEDLQAMLAAADSGRAAPLAALLFTCNGRGTRLFEQPHHDAAALARRWPGLPVAGFFAQGEIGPIGGKNFLHGFTASIALLEHRNGYPA